MFKSSLILISFTQNYHVAVFSRGSSHVRIRWVFVSAEHCYLTMGGCAIDQVILVKWHTPCLSERKITLCFDPAGCVSCTNFHWTFCELSCSEFLCALLGIWRRLRILPVGERRNDPPNDLLIFSQRMLLHMFTNGEPPRRVAKECEKRLSVVFNPSSF